MKLAASLGRRRVLRLMVLAGGLSVARLNPFASSSAAAEETAAALSDALGGLFRHPESVRAVGLAYLARYPLQGRAEQWLAALCAERDTGMPALCRRDREELRAWVAGAIREDFAAGRIVDLNGWQLAETEATLCAVVATRGGRL